MERKVKTRVIYAVVALLTAAGLLAGCDPRMGKGGAGAQNSGAGSIPRSGAPMEAWKEQGGITVGSITFPPDNAGRSYVEPTGKPKQLIQDIYSTLNKEFALGGDPAISIVVHEMDDPDPNGFFEFPIMDSFGVCVVLKNGKTCPLDNGMVFEECTMLEGCGNEAGSIRYQSFGTFTKDSVRHSYNLICDRTGTSDIHICQLDDGWYDISGIINS